MSPQKALELAAGLMDAAEGALGRQQQPGGKAN
jgi:hypothetical protein